MTQAGVRCVFVYTDGQVGSLVIEPQLVAARCYNIARPPMAYTVTAGTPRRLTDLEDRYVRIGTMFDQETPVFAPDGWTSKLSCWSWMRRGRTDDPVLAAQDYLEEAHQRLNILARTHPALQGGILVDESTTEAPSQSSRSLLDGRRLRLYAVPRKGD